MIPSAITKPIKTAIIFLFSKSALGDFLISILLFYDFILRLVCKCNIIFSEIEN
jgi:hypothetical protein